MNAPKKLAFILSAIAMALPQTASAQSLSKAWTGTWHLNTEKSKFSSAEFTSKSDTRTYTVAGRRLTMQSTMIGISRRILESKIPAREHEAMREQMVTMLYAYSESVTVRR